MLSSTLTLLEHSLSYFPSRTSFTVRRWGRSLTRTIMYLATDTPAIVPASRETIRSWDRDRFSDSPLYSYRATATSTVVLDASRFHREYQTGDIRES